MIWGFLAVFDRQVELGVAPVCALVHCQSGFTGQDQLYLSLDNVTCNDEEDADDDNDYDDYDNNANQFLKAPIVISSKQHTQA